jgi:phosphate/sulfate permease
MVCSKLEKRINNLDLIIVSVRCKGQGQIILPKGIPTSLVQLNAGAIIGIGVARLGAKNIFRKTSVNKFFFVWANAPFITFLLSLALTYLIDKMGYL